MLFIGRARGWVFDYVLLDYVLYGGYDVRGS